MIKYRCKHPDHPEWYEDQEDFAKSMRQLIIEAIILVVMIVVIVGFIYLFTSIKETERLAAIRQLENVTESNSTQTITIHLDSSNTTMAWRINTNSTNGTATSNINDLYDLYDECNHSADYSHDMCNPCNLNNTQVNCLCPLRGGCG